MSLAFANNLRRFAPKGLAQQAARALSTAVAHEPFFAHDKLGGRSSWNGKQLVESEWWGKQLSEEHLAELGTKWNGNSVRPAGGPKCLPPPPTKCFSLHAFQFWTRHKERNVLVQTVFCEGSPFVFL